MSIFAKHLLDKLDEFADGERFGVYSHVPERHSYVATIARRQGPTIVILTVGEELTEPAIKEWIDATLKMMRESDRDDVEAPDYRDRSMQ